MSTKIYNCTLNVEQEFWYDEIKGDWDEVENSSDYLSIVNQCNGSVERGYVIGEFNQNLSPGGDSTRPNQYKIFNRSECCSDNFEGQFGLISSKKLNERKVDEYYTSKENIGLDAQITYVFYCISSFIQNSETVWRRDLYYLSKTAPIKRYKRIVVFEEDWQTEWRCNYDPPSLNPDCCDNSSSSSSPETLMTSESINSLLEYLELIDNG